MSKIRPLILVVVTITIVGSWGVTSPASSQSDETDADPTMAAIETQIAQLEATGTALAVQPTSTSTAAATDPASPAATGTTTCELPTFSMDPIGLDVTSVKVTIRDQIRGAPDPNGYYLVVQLTVESSTNGYFRSPVRDLLRGWVVSDGDQDTSSLNQDLSYEETALAVGGSALAMPADEVGTLVLVFETSSEITAIYLRNDRLTEPTLSSQGYELCMPERSQIELLPSAAEVRTTATATPTRTPTPRSTATPRRTLTPAAGRSGDYPASVQRIVDEDHPTRCDEIGWNIADVDEPDAVFAEDREHYAACGDGDSSVVCVSITDTGGFWTPSSGELWVVCFVGVFNPSNQEVFVSPFDFTIVDANNRRHAISFEPLVFSSSSDMFPTDTLPPGQSVGGFIGFVVPTAAAEPLRLEVTPDFGSGDTLIFILDPLLTEWDL